MLYLLHVKAHICDLQIIIKSTTYKRAVEMPLIDVVLFEPEIPSNTGNIMRLCHNTGAKLHLVHPLGFELDDKRLRRAGLDYADWQHVKQWHSLDACIEAIKGNAPESVWHPMTTKGSASPFSANLSGPVVLLYGPETRGLPEVVRQLWPQPQWLKLPMQAGSRSLNLSNAVAIGVYEAWRQQGFN